MQTIQLPIEGMTCQGCVKSVQQVLENMAGVKAVSVDLIQGLATIDYQQNQHTPQDFIQAIENAGFEVPNR